jgi:hypothetical protein
MSLKNKELRKRVDLKRHVFKKFVISQRLKSLLLALWTEIQPEAL